MRLSKTGDGPLFFSGGHTTLRPSICSDGLVKESVEIVIHKIELRVVATVVGGGATRK